MKHIIIILWSNSYSGPQIRLVSLEVDGKLVALHLGHSKGPDMRCIPAIILDLYLFPQKNNSLLKS